jgi:APA family basic amino acid/polyamine antiporter
MTAVVVLGGLAVLQWVGVRSAGRLQEVTTVVKALALLAVAAAAFFVVPAAPSAVVVPREASLALAFALAMQGVLFTYDSYYWMVYYGEDLTAPERDIPRSMFRGLAVIIVVYLLLNLAFLRLLPMDQLAGANFAGGALAAVIFGQHGDAVIRGIMIVSLLGALNAQLLAAPRILYAMAGDRLFPSRGLVVSARGTPSIGLAVTLAVTALFLLSGTFTAVLAAISVIIVVNYVLIYASLFMLRRREPDAPRPYRAWGYPWVQTVAFIIALAFLIGVAMGDPRGTLLGVGVLAAAVPVYLLVARFSR